MKLFHVDDTITSYKQPIIKIIVIATIDGALFAARMLSPKVQPPSLDLMIGSVCAAFMMLSFFWIIIALCDMDRLSDRREKERMNYEKALSKGKWFPTEKVKTLLSDNDIIDVFILSDQKILRIGASSRDSYYTSEFSNKKYYLNEEEDVTIEKLEEVIDKSSSEKGVFVVQVDGVPGKKY